VTHAALLSWPRPAPKACPSHFPLVPGNPKHRVMLVATGAKLLTVAELMAATGLGQTSVCKALNELEREGNVRRSPRKTAGALSCGRRR
jgi:predicted Rossmann fold nucleotide-binding protein DprA/Smf involved in DNA uptake